MPLFTGDHPLQEVDGPEPKHRLQRIWGLLQPIKLHRPQLQEPLGRSGEIKFSLQQRRVRLLAVFPPSSMVGSLHNYQCERPNLSYTSKNLLLTTVGVDPCPLRIYMFFVHWKTLA